MKGSEYQDKNVKILSACSLRKLRLPLIESGLIIYKNRGLSEGLGSTGGISFLWGFPPYALTGCCAVDQRRARHKDIGNS